ncbi:hypothetical protein PISL3812_00307 [Talaromyces islandicus]|uniref:Uncharacterized protein n=1 Tax=Talaromyces islandicus TaxID=28573 RepID=A0A0U1LKV5_TALIS|nr:hypothetical protein PISL3812_00307 [Talaromyces islandicus]
MGTMQIAPRFVNSFDLNDIKTSSKQPSVRSHVARYQWKTHKRAAQKKGAREQFLPYRVEFSMDFRNDGAANASPETENRIPRLLGGYRVDPFRSYPVWRPYLPLVIDHLSMAVDIPEIDGPFNRGLLRTQWFSLAISSNALFLVILLLSTSHYAASHKHNKLKVDLFQLRYEAVWSINKALETSHQTVDDTLIGAVAKMASYEAMFGTLDTYDMHMRGLSRMIELRGGLCSLGLNGLLQRIVIWIDYNSAFLHGRSERYFPNTTLDDATPNPGNFLGAS